MFLHSSPLPTQLSMLLMAEAPLMIVLTVKLGRRPIHSRLVLTVQNYLQLDISAS